MNELNYDNCRFLKLRDWIKIEKLDIDLLYLNENALDYLERNGHHLSGLYAYSNLPCNKNRDVFKLIKKRRHYNVIAINTPYNFCREYGISTSKSRNIFLNNINKHPYIHEFFVNEEKDLIDREQSI